MTSKEELGKIKKLIFIMGEILVAESKQDISPEEAIQRIRKTCNKYGVNGTDYETIKQDLDRLEEYRKIEKELGLDLKVYHKLMNMLYCGEPNILYIKDKDKIVQVGILEIDYCKKKIIFYKDKSYNDDYVYGFIQYGKTWSLDKGDLENDK